jgi:hypothetical protein
MIAQAAARETRKAWLVYGWVNSGTAKAWSVSKSWTCYRINWFGKKAVARGEWLMARNSYKIVEFSKRV